MLGETQVQLQGIENPLTLLYVLIVIRIILDRRAPFLGIVAFHPGSLVNSCNKLCRKLYLKISNLGSRSIFHVVIFIIGISLLIKIFNSYHFIGFFSGDDVEIHEMTFAHLFEWDSKAWNLRSPFFPMVFIYPIQAALLALGVQDPFYLIFAGRMIVVLFSLVNLYLVFQIAARMFNSKPVGLLSVFFFALSKLHVTMGSTELPRTIASTFILLCFWLLLLKKNQSFWTPLAGTVLAVGASIRFGEIIFVVPAFLYLVFHKRLKQAFVFAAFFLAAFSLINVLSDRLYWGQPFYSLLNIIDYTLVKGQSTRGYQPLLYYLLGIGLWSNYFSFGLMLFSLRRKLYHVWLWAFAPIAFLSLLPHKEPRYLLPALPFFCIMVGLATWSLLDTIYRNDVKLKIPKKIPKPVYALLIILMGTVIQAHKDPRFSYIVIFLVGLILLTLLIPRWKAEKMGAAVLEREVSSPSLAVLLILIVLGSILFEVNGFYFARSESGVEMARFLYHQPNNEGVAVDDIWRAGGRLYLLRKPAVINIDESLIRDRDALLASLREIPVGWVGIRDKYIKQYGYDALLEESGYKEVRFSHKIRQETYRLFKKENRLLK